MVRTRPLFERHSVMQGCAALRNIYRVAHRLAECQGDHKGVFPAKLAALVKERYVKAEEL